MILFKIIIVMKFNPTLVDKVALTSSIIKIIQSHALTSDVKKRAELSNVLLSQFWEDAIVPRFFLNGGNL